MCFNNVQLMGMDFGFPDVCLTPIAGVPTPLPYPNIAMKATAIPTALNILNMCAPIHNLTTITPLSNGDNVGVMMGVASGIVMGPAHHVLGSTCLLNQCMPQTRCFMDMTIQNSTNCPGTNLMPSQVTCMTLR